VIAALAWAAPVGAVQITEYTIEPGSAAGTHQPRFIMYGSDGNFWFTDGGTAPAIGRLNPNGEFLPPISRPAQPTDISQAPGATSVAWTEQTVLRERLANGEIFPAWSAGTAGTIYAVLDIPSDLLFTGRQASNSTSKLCDFPLTDMSFVDCETGPVVATTPPTDITLGPDGKFWVAGFESDTVHRHSTEMFEELEVTFPAGSRPHRIASGPDGNLWVTSYGASAIDRVTPAGLRTRFPLPPGTAPKDIAVGPDGALWFTEEGANAIGRITTAGEITHYPVPTPASAPAGIVSGPDGAVWFTERAAGKIGRLLPDPPGGPAPGPGPGGPSHDGVAPAFTEPLRAEPSRFPTPLRGSTAQLRRRSGTTFHWALSEPARVTIAIQARRPGRRVDGRCRRPTRRNRTRPACRRWVTLGRLSHEGGAGPNSRRFSGRLRRRALRPGRYRAAARAVDAAGNRSALSIARFRVVRR
jgi:streptogramin lyase